MPCGRSQCSTASFRPADATLACVVRPRFYIESALLLLLVACGSAPAEEVPDDAGGGGHGGALLGGFEVNCGSFVEKGVDGIGNAPIAGCLDEDPASFSFSLTIEGVDTVSLSATEGRLPSAVLRGDDACDATTIEFDGSLQPGAPRITLFATLDDWGSGPATGEYVGFPFANDIMSLKLTFTELGEVGERVSGGFEGVNRAGNAVSGGFSACRIEPVPESP